MLSWCFALYSLLTYFCSSILGQSRLISCEPSFTTFLNIPLSFLNLDKSSFLLGPIVLQLVSFFFLSKNVVFSPLEQFCNFIYQNHQMLTRYSPRPDAHHGLWQGS